MPFDYHAAGYVVGMTLGILLLIYLFLFIVKKAVGKNCTIKFGISTFITVLIISLIISLLYKTSRENTVPASAPQFNSVQINKFKAKFDTKSVYNAVKKELPVDTMVLTMPAKWYYYFEPPVEKGLVSVLGLINKDAPGAKRDNYSPNILLFCINSSPEDFNFDKMLLQNEKTFEKKYNNFKKTAHDSNGVHYTVFTYTQKISKDSSAVIKTSSANFKIGNRTYILYYNDLVQNYDANEKIYYEVINSINVK